MGTVQTAVWTVSFLLVSWSFVADKISGHVLNDTGSDLRHPQLLYLFFAAPGAIAWILCEESLWPLLRIDVMFFVYFAVGMMSALVRPWERWGKWKIRPRALNVPGENNRRRCVR